MLPLPYRTGSIYVLSSGKKEDVIAADYSLDDMLNDNEGVGVDKTETHALKSIEKSPVKDQVRFSDQIKTKLKSMKQIQ